MVLAALAAFGACALMTTVGLIRWRLRRRNRVDPAQPSAAPLRWLASPTEPARLHRRLRTIAHVGIVNPEIDEHATAEIVTVASRLDHRRRAGRGRAQSEPAAPRSGSCGSRSASSSTSPAA